MNDRDLREHLKLYGCPQVFHAMLDIFPVASLIDVLGEAVEHHTDVPGSAVLARDLKQFAERLPESAWNQP